MKKFVKRMMGVILIPVLIYIFVVRVCYWAETGPNTIIYDCQKNKVVLRLSFYQWYKYQWDKPKFEKESQERRYFFAPEDIEFGGIVANVSYKAKVHLSLDNKALYQYRLYSLNYHSDEEAELHMRKAVEDCVVSAIRIPNKVEGYPTIIIRALSISNMNDLCPLSPEYGYQWVGDLEIAQCFVNDVKDPWQKENCWNLVKNRQ